jgi:hypothetical protein
MGVSGTTAKTGLVLAVGDGFQDIGVDDHGIESPMG